MTLEERNRIALLDFLEYRKKKEQKERVRQLKRQIDDECYGIDGEDDEEELGKTEPKMREKIVRRIHRITVKALERPGEEVNG